MSDNGGRITPRSSVVPPAVVQLRNSPALPAVSEAGNTDTISTSGSRTRATPGGVEQVLESLASASDALKGLVDAHSGIDPKRVSDLLSDD
jgi:hypothetical protein